RAPPASRSELPLTMVRVVAGDDRGVEHLFQGVRASLTGLELHEVEHLALAVEQEIVEPEEDAGPLTKTPPRPRPLRDAGTVSGDSNVVGGAPWYVAAHRAAERGVHGDCVPSTAIRRALTCQTIEPALADGPHGAGGHRVLHAHETRRTGAFNSCFIPAGEASARNGMVAGRVARRPLGEPGRLRERAATEQDGRCV